MRWISKFSSAWRVLLVAPFLATAGAAERADTPVPPTGRAPLVILISLDGTRPADLNPGDLPVLMGLADRGLRAQRLLPVLPTNTFPNHVTLVTGVEPERHGIVNNVFIDPERGFFEKDDIPSWIQVEPLWSLLERRGITSASYHWVGSEGRWPGGRAPRYWMPFSKATPEFTKVEKILEWLSLPDPGARPRFVTAWFRGGDHSGHHHGPGHARVQSDLREQDVAIAALWNGLGERGLRASTTLLFVSDHGMAAAATRVDLTAMLKEGGLEFQALGIGGFTSVYLEDASPKEIERVTAPARRAGLFAEARIAAAETLPVDNPRFGDVIAIAPAGTAITHAGVSLEGFHGYVPQDPSMAGIFVAVGRGIPKDRIVPVVRSIDVAPTILALLGEEVPDWMQGRPLPELLTKPGKTAASDSAILASEKAVRERSRP